MHKFLLILLVFLMGCGTIHTPISIPETTYNFYLPIIYSSSSLPIVGVQDESRGAYASYYAKWSRVHIPLKWEFADTYGLSTYNAVKDIAEKHWTIIGIRTTPDRYKLWYNIPCSPPAPQYYRVAADFFLEAVEYLDVQAVAIWNEPYGAPEENSLSFIGCWGTDVTAGLRYGQFVSVIYDTIKTARPETIVIAGEFSGIQTDFVTGFFVGANNHFDAISFHNYAWYQAQWNGPGATVSFLRQSTDKPLYWTETALMYEGDCTNPEFQAAAVEHFDEAMRYTYELGIESFFWYPIYNGTPPWRCTDLLYNHLSTPVYERYLEYGKGEL